MCHKKRFEHVEILRIKKAFGESLLLDIELLDRVGEPVRRIKRLGNDFDLLGVGYEAILRIRRLRRSVCGAHGCFAPPPSHNILKFKC